MSSHSITSSAAKAGRSVDRTASRDLGVGEYSRRTGTRRLPAVLLASALLVGALFAMRIPLEGLTLLLLIPLLALPVIVVLWVRG
jgi:hypothetical protein